MSLPTEYFRAGVGAVVVNAEGMVLALSRKDLPGSWQMPQGGLEAGESTLEAALREVEEETGIGRGQLEPITESRSWTAYELPSTARKDKTGRGQVQKWHLLAFRGDPESIDLTEASTDEFEDYRWTSLAELTERVVYFRRPVYRQLMREFRAFLAGPARPARSGDELKIADFRYWSDSFWRNEELGERRLQFLIGFTTVVAGAVGFMLEQAGDIPFVAEGAIFAWVMLLSLGAMTFLRMVKRNKVTDEYKDHAREIRTILAGAEYTERVLGPERPKDPRKLSSGGLVHTTAVFNSLLFGGGVALLTSGFGFMPQAWLGTWWKPLVVTLIGLVSAAIALGGQVWLAKRLSRS